MCRCWQSSSKPWFSCSQAELKNRKSLPNDYIAAGEAEISAEGELKGERQTEPTDQKETESSMHRRSQPSGPHWETYAGSSRSCEILSPPEVHSMVVSRRGQSRGRRARILTGWWGRKWRPRGRRSPPGAPGWHPRRGWSCSGRGLCWSCREEDGDKKGKSKQKVNTQELKKERATWRRGWMGLARSEEGGGKVNKCSSRRGGVTPCPHPTREWPHSLPRPRSALPRKASNGQGQL